jgi:Mg-chelatase subunit ChlI
MTQRRSVYPFTAIVGQERMKRALILNAIDPGIGGVLIRGERGTAKSTAVRALAALLPDIETVADCPFNCDPNKPNALCDQCAARLAKGETLPTTKRKLRIIDLPVSATEDRVVGTFNFDKAIKEGERHFEAGILGAANRGILYVDEVNLLDDHVVDLLLDSAAMGVNIVEREGISFQHPARFILVGTMNPEEGDLRPQLLDRFALSVEVRGIAEARERIAILERRVGFDTHPEGFAKHWVDSEQQLSDEIGKASTLIEDIAYTSRDLYAIATLTAQMSIDGHRADLVILKTARANAAYEGRNRVTDRDIWLAAELALPHRMRRTPLQDAQSTIGDLGNRVEKIMSEYQEPSEATPTPSSEATTSKKKLSR